MSEEPTDHLLLWRSDEPLEEEEALPLLRALEASDSLVGSAEGVAADWAGQRVGCVVLKGEPTLDSPPFADWDLVPFGEGIVLEGDQLTWAREPMALPAAPLVVKRGRDWAFASSVDVELDFDEPSAGQLELLEELTELFLESYRGEGIGALEGAALAERAGAGRTLSLRGWAPPDEGIGRGHLHWWIEEVARFLPLREARILPRRAARRGLPPSWIGPLVVIAVAFGVRWLDPTLALRAGCLVWAFGALMVTFFSRAYVGRVTWAVAAANALVQAALALLVVRPDLLVGSPPAGDTDALLGWAADVRSTLEWVLYGSGAMGLVWVLTYLANRRRPV